MNQTIITADSTFDLPPPLAEELNIKIIPSYVRLGEIIYDDYPKIGQADLFAYYERTRELPQTAAANPNDYLQFFSHLSFGGNAVIHIAKSSKISSCYNNAALAAGALNNVYVVDSKNMSGGSAMLALAAAKQARNLPPKELVDYLCAYRERIDGGFIIEQLEYLHKGGRCSSVAALGANALRLRPGIQIRDGKMTVARKYRGSYEKCVLRYIDERLSELDNICPEYLIISHSIQDSALLNRACARIKAKGFFEKVIAWPVSAGIAVHCGPNTFALFYTTKVNQ